MYRANKPLVKEEDEDDDDDDNVNEDNGDIATMIVDQFCSVRPPREYINHNSGYSNHIYSNKQPKDEIDPTKYQPTSRSSSLPARQTFSSNKNTEENVKQRRRYASGSHTNNNTTAKTTSLVTSFLQYLRSELKATTNENINDYQRIKKKKSTEALDYTSQRMSLSDRSPRLSNRPRISSGSESSLLLLSSPSSSSSLVTPSSQSMTISTNKLSNDNLLKNTFDNNYINDDNEIATLINLLILRIEVLNDDNPSINMKNNKNKSSTMKNIDQNLIEYLYFLFNKFVYDESSSNGPIINKTKFVNVCQTIARSGSLNMLSSSDHSLSESTLTNTNDQTLMQTLVRDLKTDTDDMSVKNASINEKNSSIPTNDDDSWVVIDLEQTKPQDAKLFSDESKCLLSSSSTSDDQLLPTNEIYFSVDEVKSCESESSHSNYYSPDSSLVDVENMSQENDEINNINNNNNNNINDNNNATTTVFNQDGSSSSTTEHSSNSTNVIIEAKDTTSNKNICIGSTNDCITNSNEQQVASSTMNTIEQMTMNSTEKMSRRERKMQERWTTTTKTNKNSTEQVPSKTFLGVEFPPIAVLRRKFSSSPPSKTNTLPIKKKDDSPTKTKISVNKDDKANASHDNISKLNDYMPPTPLNRSMSLQNQEINTLITTDTVDKTKYEHEVFDLQPNDTSSLLICCDSKTNDDTQQSSTIISDLLTDVKNLQEDMKIRTQQDLIEFENEILSTTNNYSDQLELVNRNNNNNNSTTINDSCDLHLLPSSSSLLLKSSSSSSSSSSSTANTNEDKTIELLPTEIEEEKKNEEEHCDDDNVHVEKKNKRNVEHNNHHTSGIILINDESTQAVLLEQEKKENEEEQEQEKERPLPTLEQCNHQPFQDESSMEILSNNLTNNIIMSNIDDNENRYKTIEIEEIPDEDDLSEIINDRIVEPTDYILTDDELQVPRKSSTKSTIPKNNDESFEIDPILSYYRKGMTKLAENIDDTTKISDITSTESQTAKTVQRPEDDPIALRALKRFEQRMNAAMATKINHEDGNSSLAKGKSSWSGTQTASRKSLENVFKTDQSTSSTNEQPITTPLIVSPRDTFIRPRKTILDDIGLNLGMTRSLFSNIQLNTANNHNNHKSEEEEEQQQQQQPPIAIVKNNEKQVTPDESKAINSPEGHQQHENPTIINLPMANENVSVNEAENLNSLATSTVNGLSNTVISHSSNEQQTLSPYRLQLEGRRRLNALERARDRQEIQESNNVTQQIQNKYTLKPEELQDPIIRRALERFDEKSRSLAQTQPRNYDDIEDPITRRALMRLETNLKRTVPQPQPPPPSQTTPATTTIVLPISTNDSNETWYTNSYTLGSLQTNNDIRPTMRYPDPSLPPTPFNRTSLVSVHQRFCSTSSADMSEPSTNSTNSNNEPEIPIMRVPAQPIYVTSNNHHQLQPSVTQRQRSHSEDMLSSRDLSINEIINPDTNNTVVQLQRNHSSDHLQSQPLQQQQQPQQTPIQKSQEASNEISSTTTDHQLPTTIVKSLDSNFIRMTEASANYVTPTQTYSAYSCEYTRPHQNSSVTSPQVEITSPRNYQQSNGNDARYSNVSSSSSSAFTPVHPMTNNYTSQQPVPVSSYASTYGSNNVNQTPYSDDPIVRRALERFNSQIQNSLMSMPQYQPATNGLYRQMSNGYSRQGNFDSFYPTDPPTTTDPWSNGNRPVQPTSNTGTTGYQSIIGRRRQLRHDDVFHDPSTVGNGYSSSTFMNSQHPYAAINNAFMNFTEEPPAIPPRLHRDLFREQQEYLCQNVNNNNNNNLYMQQSYPTGPNGFRPINHSFIPPDAFHQYQDEEYLRHRAQSTSSTASSDSLHPIRLNKQQIPPTFARTNVPQAKKVSPDDSQAPSGHTTPSNGSTAGDSVFQRLAYTATKSSLSKSSSNLCANLLTKPSQQEQPKSNNLKSYEIDYDDSSTASNKQELLQTSTSMTNKCQRSRSVDGRARLKNAQARSMNNNSNNNNNGNSNNHNNRPTNDSDDNNSTVVPSSKFTPANPRRDAPPPRIPITPRSTTAAATVDRASLTKRVASGHNLAYGKNANGTRTRNSHGNLMESDNDENLAFNDNYQPKIIDSKSRTSIPGHRFGTNNNHIQASASTSCVNSTMSRTKGSMSMISNLDKRDSNLSGTDLNRSSKRSDENRLISPMGQRRNVPVSVFSPAKNESKRPAPVPSSSTSPSNDSNSLNNGEITQEQQQQQQQQQPEHPTTYSSRSTGDSSYTTMNNSNEINTKLSSTNLALKTSTGNILDELSLTHDKHDTNKKMNVFERLFRGHKKKV